MGLTVAKVAVLERLLMAGAATATVLASSTLVPLEAAAASSSQPTARNLAISGPVTVELVDADAAFKHLPADDFIGLREAYYAYDVTTSTYWGAAQVVPSATAFQAQVSSQDDGGYTVFHKAPHDAWVAVDDGMGGQGCAQYHVGIPPAVLAVWHWPAGTCTPPNASGPLLLTYYASAAQQWRAGAAAISAKQAYYWLAASKDLAAAVTSKAPGTNGYPVAAHQLTELAKLPDAMQTAAESEQYVTLTRSLNLFFGTNGLYGQSEPSRTAKAFVATLEQEANLGTLSVVADPRLGRVPSSFLEGVVTCPVLSGVAAGSVFGCKVETFQTYFLVGTIETDEATTYLAYIVGGHPLFECATDGLSTAEQLAAKKMGGGCAP